MKILSGLGLEFQAVSTAIRAMDSPLTYEELYDKIIDHELFLKHEELKKSPSTMAVVVVQRTNNAISGLIDNQLWNQPHLSSNKT